MKEELLKEACYLVLKDVANELFDNYVIGPATYEAITDKDWFYKAVESKYKYIDIAENGTKE